VNLGQWHKKNDSIEEVSLKRLKLDGIYEYFAATGRDCFNYTENLFQVIFVITSEKEAWMNEEKMKIWEMSPGEDGDYLDSSRAEDKYKKEFKKKILFELPEEVIINNVVYKREKQYC
jgi:hypothetical protein